MKEILLQYAAYNIWAQDIIVGAISALPVELIEKQVESSFESLRQNVFHLSQTGSIWWQRIHLVENVLFSPENENLPVNELCNELKKQASQYYELISKTKELNFAHVIAYQNSKKEQFKQPFYEILLHVFNHNTYHRGQIITIFHQLNIAKIPNTDFINWSRSRKKQL